MKQRKGFTLLELLVVVGILATLVALALPYYQDYINQSRITAANADLTSFAKALSLYEQTEGTYATATFLPLIGKYMQDFRTYSGQAYPKDPWGNDYKINATYGSIICCGPDTQNNTNNNHLAQNDDLISTYKPPFFISSARGINATMIEVVFSRRILHSSVTAGNFTVTGITGKSVQKVSETIYRIVLNSAMTVGSAQSLTVTGVTDQNGLSIVATDQNPVTGANGNTTTFTF